MSCSAGKYYNTQTLCLDNVCLAIILAKKQRHRQYRTSSCSPRRVVQPLCAIPTQAEAFQFDQAGFGGGGSGNPKGNGGGHANGGGTVSSRDSESDSDSGGGGGVDPENGSSGGDSRNGGGRDELTASQVCTFVFLRLQFSCVCSHKR